MDDLISRQEALKKLKESAEHHANDSREEALLRRDRDIIRALPSVNPQKWIPVSEKLPEEGEDVLACFYTSGGNYKMMVSRRSDYNYWSGVGRTGDMIAWMPLPKPYHPDINIGNMSEIPTGSKDVIWYNKKNYSEIISEPQESEEV